MLQELANSKKVVVQRYFWATGRVDVVKSDDETPGFGEDVVEVASSMSTKGLDASLARIIGLRIDGRMMVER